VLVSVSSASGLQLRTLVLRSAGGHVSYTLQRGLNPSLGEADLVPVAPAQRALDTAVATLVAPNGGEADDQGQSLAQFDVGFVLVPAPVNQSLARLLDGVADLRPVTATSAFALWRLVEPSARARVVEPGGTVVALRSGDVSVANATAPAAGGTLELAEPAGGWSATLNGTPLTPVPSPAGAWAQAFRLPPGGGLVNISHDQGTHDIALVIEALALAAAVVLALPGARATATESLHGAGSSAVAGRDSADAPESDRPGAPRRQRQGRAAGRRSRRVGQEAAVAANAGAALDRGESAVRPGARSAHPPDASSSASAEHPDLIAVEPSGRPPVGVTGWAADASAGRLADRPGADQPSSWDGADRELNLGEPGQRPDWPGGDQRDWPGGDQRDWPGGDQRDWPAGDQRDWPGGDQRPGWDDAGQQPHRPAAQPAGRSAAQSLGWPSGYGDALDPLPSADGSGPAWTGSATRDDVPPPRWPVPDRDTEGEAW